jgi:DNA-binding beta-propeller fold protein YncE
MNRLFKLTFIILIAAALVAAALPMDVAQARGSFDTGKIVVANRGSGTISVLDAYSGAVRGTYALPEGAGGNTPEPMYVVYTHTGNQVFVGDRANDRLVVFDADSFDVKATVPTGAGVFHMWANLFERQLWVNNDIDKTSTVINPRTLEVMATVPTPADLIAMGGKPHDVILDPLGKFAYVSLVGVAGDYDYVVQYSAKTFEETGRVPVGKDPHLSLTWRNNYLYVASQGGNSLSILNRYTLEPIEELAIPGAHGAGMALNGKYFYTTNLPGGGSDALYTIRTKDNSLVGEAVDTPYAVPHNIALTPILSRLFVTHSGGTADKVTFYSVSVKDPVPNYLGEVTVGLNPFGLAYVP